MNRAATLQGSQQALPGKKQADEHRKQHPSRRTADFLEAIHESHDCLLLLNSDVWHQPRYDSGDVLDRAERRAETASGQNRCDNRGSAKAWMK